MNKAGYVYVNEQSVSPSLICPICLDVLEEPHTHVPCDSAFCRSCLLQLAEPFCPICRWTWSDSVPLQYNIHLPKANRLIRNMLDDLPVRCLRCHTVRRRGQFDHRCRKMLTIPMIDGERWSTVRMIFSAFVVGLFLALVYLYRHHVFQRAIDRRYRLANGIGYNIDSILLDCVYSVTMKMIEYPMTLLLINICSWLSVRHFGARLTSSRNSRLLTKFFEIFIITNLIVYSVHH